MRRLTITFDVAFGKDEPEEPAEQIYDGANVSAIERSPVEDFAGPTIGFRSAPPWEEQ